MAKKKSAKKSVKRPSRKVSVVNQEVHSKKEFMTRGGWFIVKVLLIAVFVFGLYKLWISSWKEGLSIIVLVLIIYLVIKLIYKLKRK